MHMECVGSVVRRGLGCVNRCGGACMQVPGCLGGEICVECVVWDKARTG